MGRACTVCTTELQVDKPPQASNSAGYSREIAPPGHRSPVGALRSDVRGEVLPEVIGHAYGASRFRTTTYNGCSNH